MSTKFGTQKFNAETNIQKIDRGSTHRSVDQNKKVMLV